MKFIIALVLVLSAAVPGYAFERGSAYKGKAEWNEFQSYITQQEEQNRHLGLSYLISGGIAAVGGAIGYQQSDDILSRSVFVIASNMGIAAFRWGATYYFTSSEISSFYHSLEGSSLTAAQKNEVLQRYLKREKEEQEKRRWIGVATHVLLAGLNFYSASQEHDSNIKSMFYVLGGANTILAISHSF